MKKKKIAFKMKKLKSPFYVVIEGLDGSGKTTLAKEVVSQLQKKKYPTVYEHEPTDLIKNFVGDVEDRVNNVDANDYRDLVVFLADRILHVDRMKEDKIYVLDRYMLSTFAYQVKNQTAENVVFSIMRYLPHPDLAFFLNTPIEICQKNSGIDYNTARYLEGKYKEYIKKQSDRYFIIPYSDLDKEVEIVISKIIDKIG